MRIHLGGHLAWYDREKRDWLEIAQPQPIALAELAAALGVPRAEVALVSVNRRLVHWDDGPVAGEDVVEFYPPMGGGSRSSSASPYSAA
jgi:sulfur carrier protein ThiS